MKARMRYAQPRAMSLIDVLVGVSIMLIIFLSIFGAFKLAIELVYSTKAKAGGMSLVSQQLEYVRGLPYTSIGTVGGIPSGPVAQLATTTINNIPYTVRTLVLYVDAPQDGSGSSDSTGVTADYKLVKVEATWTIKNAPRSTFAVTHIAPHGVESLTNGGTLRVNVFDAVAAPVPDASVRIQNTTTVPTIDLTLESDAQGVVLIPGAPAASNYQISVTKSGYSSAQTYTVTTGNPNPNPGHVAIANQQTTTASFGIDRTGSIRFNTYSPLDVGFFSDTFTNQNNLSATTSTTVSGGALVLFDDPMTGYPSNGDALSAVIAPPQLASWDTLTVAGDTPSNTMRAVQLYYSQAGTDVLVPDAALPGNSAGLASDSISLAGVSTSTYQSLKIKGLLGTSDASTTPSIASWQLDYHAGPSPLPNIGITVQGAKSIGNTAGGSLIYKYTSTITTDTFGEKLVSPLEWDAYTLGLSGSTYDIGEQCPDSLGLQPAQAQSVSLTLYPHTTTSLRVVVSASGGVPISGAAITLTGPTAGSDTSSSCGQAFFSNRTAGNYTVQVSKSGYQTNTQNVSVSGSAVTRITLQP